MKSSVLFILSLLLALAILTPSIVTLVSCDENNEIIIDFNEEEKKEEKKESTEKDFIFYSDGHLFSNQEPEENLVSEVYFEGNYATCVVIFLPPPKLS